MEVLDPFQDFVGVLLGHPPKVLTMFSGLV